MDAARSAHPTLEILSSYGLGKLDEPLAKAVNEHLEKCADCRKHVAELSADSFLGRVRDAQATDNSIAAKSQFYGSPSLEETGPVQPIPANTLPPGLADHPDYEIKGELGRGGMGVVYLAHNKLMGRDEVLKVMGRHIMERPGVLDRFLREIRAVAKLRHPNIVTAYHATRLGETIVFAMEYVDGADLSKMVKATGPLPVAHACHFVHQAALGLQYAHEEGLVHRDIKPGNLMFSRRKDKATIKILDFGLAKLTREEKIDLKLTSEGQAIGTPDYIAPEQIVDAPSADIRSDIYSLGGTLYHLLTGRPPFQANSLYDMYQAHMSRDADPLNFVRLEVPVELAAVVAKMMAKDPARRFQTPGEVARALAPFFKKGSAAFGAPRAGESQANLSAAGEPVKKEVSARTNRAMEIGGPDVPANKAVVPAVSQARWESLIELSDTRRSTEAAPAVAPGRRVSWRSWPVAIAASLFGLIALGVIIITIKNKYGEAKITVKGDVPIKVETPEVIVERDQAGDTGSTAGAGNAPETRPDNKAQISPIAEPASAITNSIGMKFVLIPAGEFMMGSDATDPHAEDEEFLDEAAGRKEKHRARITKPFYLGIHEVTRAQFRRFVGDAGYKTEAEKDGKGGMGWNEENKTWEQNPRFIWQNPGFDQTDEHPVVNVSWNDAQAFIGWASRKEGKTYRLPTEAEWEYACRAGSSTRYSFGDDPEGLAAVGNVADATAKERYPNWPWCIAARDGYVYTAPVGRYIPNAWGLFDMHGNVWEWCSDRYAVGYYKQSPVQDPQGVDGSSARMLRGGSWRINPGYDRSARRDWAEPDYRSDHLGFRLARIVADEISGQSPNAPAVPAMSRNSGPTPAPPPPEHDSASPSVGSREQASQDGLSALFGL